MTDPEASGEHPWMTGSTREGEPITSRCEFCAWYTVADSHTAVVERYQDHLREHHPKVWLQT